MTIIIDDGTFVIGNSFVTVDAAEAYHESRGYTIWIDGEDEEKEAALIRAFDFLSVQNWKTTVFENSVPIKIQQAQILGALKELSSPGSLQPDIVTGIKSESLDGVIETEYFKGGTGTLFTAVENMIKPYIITKGTKTKIVRGGGVE